MNVRTISETRNFRKDYVPFVDFIVVLNVTYNIHFIIRNVVLRIREVSDCKIYISNGRKDVMDDKGTDGIFRKDVLVV